MNPNSQVVQAIFEALRIEAPEVLRELRDGGGTPEDMVQWASRHRLGSIAKGGFPRRVWLMWSEHPSDAQALRWVEEINGVYAPPSDEERRLVMELLAYVHVLNAREWRQKSDRVYRKLRKPRPKMVPSTIKRDARWWVLHHVKNHSIQQILDRISSKDGQSPEYSTVDKAINKVSAMIGIQRDTVSA